MTVSSVQSETVRSLPAALGVLFTGPHAPFYVWEHTTELFSQRKTVSLHVAKDGPARGEVPADTT